jgi:hypothetical protein
VGPAVPGQHTLDRAAQAGQELVAAFRGSRTSPDMPSDGRSPVAAASPLTWWWTCRVRLAVNR